MEVVEVMEETARASMKRCIRYSAVVCRGLGTFPQSASCSGKPSPTPFLLVTQHGAWCDSALLQSVNYLNSQAVLDFCGPCPSFLPFCLGALRTGNAFPSPPSHLGAGSWCHCRGVHALPSWPCDKRLDNHNRGGEGRKHRHEQGGWGPCLECHFQFGTHLCVPISVPLPGRPDHP